MKIKLPMNAPSLERRFFVISKTIILTINCWNEWTEGSYLEPDTVNGLKYLEAVRAVFAKGK
jgi:hypothetical protein